MLRDRPTQNSLTLPYASSIRIAGDAAVDHGAKLPYWCVGKRKNALQMDHIRLCLHLILTPNQTPVVAVVLALIYHVHIACDADGFRSERYFQVYHQRHFVGMEARNLH